MFGFRSVHYALIVSRFSPVHHSSLLSRKTDYLPLLCHLIVISEVGCILRIPKNSKIAFNLNSNETLAEIEI